MSTGLVTEEDNDVDDRKRGGTITDTISGEISKFIKAHGVYWIKLICDEGVIKPKPEPIKGVLRNPKPEAGFVRQGP